MSAFSKKTRYEFRQSAYLFFIEDWVISEWDGSLQLALSAKSDSRNLQFKLRKDPESGQWDVNFKKDFGRVELGIIYRAVDYLTANDFEAEISN